jgi:hypothetical protein
VSDFKGDANREETPEDDDHQDADPRSPEEAALGVVPHALDEKLLLKLQETRMELKQAKEENKKLASGKGRARAEGEEAGRKAALNLRDGEGTEQSKWVDEAEKPVKDRKRPMESATLEWAAYADALVKHATLAVRPSEVHVKTTNLGKWLDQFRALYPSSANRTPEEREAWEEDLSEYIAIFRSGKGGADLLANRLKGKKPQIERSGVIYWASEWLIDTRQHRLMHKATEVPCSCSLWGVMNVLLLFCVFVAVQA